MTSKEIRNEARSKLKGNWIKFALITLLTTLIGASGQFGDSYAVMVSSLLSMLITLSVTKLYLKFTKENQFSLDSLLCTFKQYLRYFAYLIILFLLTFVLLIIFFTIIIGILGFSIASVYDYASMETNMSFILIVALLVTFLAIFAGILVQLYLFAVPYLIIDGEGVFSSISKSVALVKGHKFKLFKLFLSFIGWYILSIFSFGIGLLFLAPYVMESQTIFYLELNDQYNI